MTTFQGTDIPLARWADVLLMYAEAEVRKNRNRSFCGCYKRSKSSKEQSRIGKFAGCGNQYQRCFSGCDPD